MKNLIKIFLASIGLIFAATAVADTFPSKPIRLIVPFPPGGGTDQHLRVIAKLASNYLKQPIIIENKAGASGSVALSGLKNDKPDGYTISVLVPTSLRLPHLTKMSYDPLKDFTYISMLSGYTYVMAVPANSAFKSWQDVVKEARAKPGSVTYGTAGTNSTMHLVMEEASRLENIKLTPIPYKGDGDMVQDLAGGQVAMGVPSMGVAPLVEAGRVRLLAIFTADRSTRFPDVPTMKQAGTDIVAVVPYGLVGPAGMDPKVVNVLAEAFKKASVESENTAVLDRLSQLNMYLGPAQYRQWAEQTYAKEGELIRSLNPPKKD